jgi:hypothetical protein
MGYAFGSQNRQDANYYITPLWYWAKNGALVLDYAVDLDLTNPNGFWKTNYGKFMDPGFILPHKFDRQKGDTTAFAATIRLKTPSINLFPPQPQVGDTALLFARINNFSLVDIPQGKIHVSFYAGDPTSGGSQIIGAGGQTSVTTVFIPGRGQGVAQMPWRVTKLPGGQLYARISFDTTEIRTDNNTAWNYFDQLSIPLSVAVQGERPGTFVLEQNYPNPFNPTTVVRYQLPVASSVKLTIYDVLGREVSVLVNEKKNAGTYEVKFDAAGLSSGVYFYRLEAGSYIQTRKLMLLK